MNFVLTVVGETACELRVSDQIPLLHSVSKIANSPINVGCRGGGCGVCKVQILEGQYKCKPMSKAHITSKELGQGIVLACRIIPSSDLTVLAIGECK
jgi:ferredoxin